jgi:ketosteroid isomerase-like protein
MESSGETTRLTGRLLEAFTAARIDRMRPLLAEDLVAYITNAEGGMDRVEGGEAYLERVAAMDLEAAEFSVAPTQPPIAVDAEQVLLMVEIRARRGDRTLHNYAAHLLRVAGGRVTEWRMVDAKPEESDAFWSRRA